MRFHYELFYYKLLYYYIVPRELYTFIRLSTYFEINSLIRNDFISYNLCVITCKLAKANY